MKLAILAAALLLPAGAPAPAPVAAPQAPAAPAPQPALPEMPNLLGSGGPDCPSFARQVAEETKRNRGADARTLDREPMAHAFLAVDRQVDGCHQVTFLRRNVAPDTSMPNTAPAPR